MLFLLIMQTILLLQDNANFFPLGINKRKICFSWIEMDDWDITFNKQNKWDSALKSGSYGLKWTIAPAKELIWDNNLKVRILPAF